MNLHYTVEEAFDDLENAISHAELHNSTSAANAKRYAQLLDDVIGLHDGVKKESAPAVGAAEAEKENTSIPSIQGDGEKVKNLLIIEESGDGELTGKVCAKSFFDLVHLYKVAKRMFESTAKESGASLAFLDFAEKNLACETEVITL